jgi:hypothetical protein
MARSDQKVSSKWGIEKLGAEDEGGLSRARGGEIFMYAGGSKSMPEYVPGAVTF